MNHLNSLRNQYTFLMKLNGGMSTKSVFRAELSNMFGLSYAANTEPHGYEFLVMVTCQGKTNNNKTLLGPACPVLANKAGCPNEHTTRLDFGQYLRHEQNSWPC